MLFRKKLILTPQSTGIIAAFL